MQYIEQKLIHVPVTNARSNNLNTYNGKHIEWWGLNPIFKYDAMLMSAHYGMTYENTRRDMGIRDDVLFFGDSGGFQLLQYDNGQLKDKKVLKLTPESVINWQLDNCNIGMTLDKPTPRDGYNQKIFNDHLEISAKNAKIASDIKANNSRNKNFKLFNCIHGINLGDMIKWKNVTEVDCEFDGYSLPTGNSQILPLRLGFAMEYSKNKPYHILGVSSARSMILMAYANIYTNTKVYFDSSAAAQGTAHHKYYNSWDMPSGTGINIKSEWSHYLPCNCPACVELNDFKDLCGYAHGSLISIHNLWWITQYAKWIEALSAYPDELRLYAKVVSKNGSLTRDMDFIDAVNDDGLEIAYNKYYNNIQTQEDWF